VSPRREPLSSQLVLFSYFLDLLGNPARGPEALPSFAGVARALRDVPEGDDGQHTHFARAMHTWAGMNAAFSDRLYEYDDRIHAHVEAINKNRTMPIQLKYFQYLAALFTEHYLERYFEEPEHRALQNDLNAYADRFNSAKRWQGEEEISFDRKSLNRLAFSMATGSGKSHLITIHYRQLMAHLARARYPVNYANILLINPHTTLSTQLRDELRTSHIPVEFYGENTVGYFETEHDTHQVQILEITRLTERVGTNDGRSIELSDLGKANILFVDEAHRGSSGEQWRAYRDTLCKDRENSFIFEYSATFEQAAGRDNELRWQYARSILFHYPYRTFYADGYGKDYSIVNIDAKAEDDIKRYRLMTAALVAFAEQLWVYGESPALAREYNIACPLWLFVGTTVTATSKTIPDVALVVEYLRDFLTDRRRAVETIGQVINGTLPLRDEQDNLVFAEGYTSHHFPVLREAFHNDTLTSEGLYEFILDHVFHTGGNPVISLHTIAKGQGEIGLRAGDGCPFFGVINVGDASGFIKTLAKERSDIHIGVHDNHTPSLFKSINEDTQVRILIGAAKFREGWSSWRVSSICLLNVGTTEGTQIIQLFGRGVRLRGRTRNGAWTLKRSKADDEGGRPAHLPVLETLHIYGVRASYMQEFKKMLDKAELTIPYQSFDVPVDRRDDLIATNLLIPKVEGDRFVTERQVSLPDNDECLRREAIHITHVVGARAQVRVSDETPVVTTQTHNGTYHLVSAVVALLNWNKIYARLAEYRQKRGWYNLILDRDRLRAIIDAKQYVLDVDDPVELRPTTPNAFARIENIVGDVLIEWVKRYYRREHDRYRQERLVAHIVDSEDDNFFEYYTVQVDTTSPQYDEIKDLLTSKLDQLHASTAEQGVRNIFFDRHLYQPLLALVNEKSLEVTVTPAGLNAGEARFIHNLVGYLNTRPAELVDVEIYLLRNLPKRGVGFFATGNFYPDFILWLVRDGVQHILFVDPKGLHFIQDSEDEKVALSTRIHEYERRLQLTPLGAQVTLDSAIVSINAPESLSGNLRGRTPEEYAAIGIYFQKKKVASREEDDPSYIPVLLQRALERMLGTAGGEPRFSGSAGLATDGGSEGPK